MLDGAVEVFRGAGVRVPSLMQLGLFPSTQILERILAIF